MWNVSGNVFAHMYVFTGRIHISVHRGVTFQLVASES